MNLNQLIDGYKAVFFDLDGTIIDTEIVANSIIEEYFASAGKPISRTDIEVVIGRPWLEALHILAERKQLSKSAGQLASEILPIYEKALDESVPTIPGVTEIIPQIAKQKTLCLVTGSTRNQATKILTKIQMLPFFSRLFTSEDYVQGKPDPAPYLLAMDHCQVKSSEVLVFEDSEVGIQSAKSVGAFVVAISAVNHYNQNLNEADLVLEDFMAFEAH